MSDHIFTCVAQKGIANMRAKKLNGFSLMEMMIVLLIVAIVAAASAPLVSKKMGRGNSTGDSPWVFTGLGSNIAYNLSGNNNSTVIIGTTTLPNGWNKKARLYIDCGNDLETGHIAFGNGNAEPFILTADPRNGRVGFSTDEIPSRTVAFGSGQVLSNRNDSVIIGHNANQGISDVYTEEAGNVGGQVIIGHNAYSRGDGRRAIAIGKDSVSFAHTVALGYRARAKNEKTGESVIIGHEAEAFNYGNTTLGAFARTDNIGSVAIGKEAEATGTASVAIGSSDFVDNCIAPKASGNYAVAIGNDSLAQNDRSIAIGHKSKSEGNSSSIAIGSLTKAQNSNTVAIGNSTEALGPFSCAIGDRSNAIGLGSVALGSLAVTKLSGRNSIAVGIQSIAQGKNAIAVGGYSVANYDNSVAIGYNVETSQAHQIVLGSNLDTVEIPGKLSYTKPLQLISDKRLKNINSLYTAGVEELKKLKIYNYTLKKDKTRTPGVGVLAQDLQKVFPNAVTEGDDGFLRIRWDDMFYAIINAVKELDDKIADIMQVTMETNSKLLMQDKQIRLQAKIIQEQKQMLIQQRKINEEQTKNIESLVKRIEKLEKQFL